MRDAKEFAEEIRSAVEDELRDSLCSESGSRNVVVLQPDSAAGGVEFDYKWRDGHVEHIEENEELRSFRSGTFAPACAVANVVGRKR